MLRKAVLASCISLLISNLAIGAEQSTEERLKIIDQQIAKYTRHRNIEIGVCFGGITLEIIGGLLLSSE